jgi:hypothetical protein
MNDVVEACLALALAALVVALAWADWHEIHLARKETDHDE